MQIITNQYVTICYLRDIDIVLISSNLIGYFLMESSQMGHYY